MAAAHSVSRRTTNSHFLVTARVSTQNTSTKTDVCLHKKAALSQSANAYRVAFLPLSRYLIQLRIAATARASDGISSITVFSNSRTIGMRLKAAVLMAAVRES